jgi:transcriptional regulator with XRE-family HTH domain
MSTRETPASRGRRRARMLRGRMAREIAAARRAAGLSLHAVASASGVTVDTIRRMEREEPGAFTVDLIAAVAEVVGLELAASLHPNGDAVRDKGQLALMDRFRNRLGPNAKLRTEVPIPITGDLRSADGTLAVRAEDGPADILIEAETHLDDIQLVLRRGGAKQRDLGAKRFVLLVADTKHNREVIRRHPELHERFPVAPRRALAALEKGEDPGGDCLIVL